MKIKEVDKTVNVAWSPESQHPIYLAAGTAAQQLDASFNTSASLDIYSLNLEEPGLDLTLNCSVPTENRFHKIAWGAYNCNADTPQGVIIGGCDDGIIQVYNVNKVFKGDKKVEFVTKKHSGAVKALDFNNFQKHLFASGGADSEIFVWDLLHSSGPSNVPLGTKIQPSEDIVWLSWNNQVQHILASAFPSKCVIWDLRKVEPIIKVTDSSVSRIKWKSVTWNPDIATQLCLASEDDQSPVVEIWDLRFATSPIKVLQGYNKGVMSVAWCPKDSELLLGCGKDDQIICWNPNGPVPGEEVVCRVQTNSQWNVDVSWCPRYPNLFSVSSFDGHMGVYSITGGQYQGETKTKIADSFPGMETYAETAGPLHQTIAELKKAPKWLKRPVGASFAFGGKLIMFNNDSKSIVVSKVVTNASLMNRSRALEQTLEAREFPAYCAHKIGTVSNPQEQNIWRFVSAHFEVDSRSQFLSLLGYSVDVLSNKLRQIRGSLENGTLENDLNSMSVKSPELQNSQYPDDESVTDLNKVPPIKSKILLGRNDDVTGLLHQALLLGDISAAVDICLDEKYFAEAIILASAGGPELLSKTRYRYFQLKQSTLSSLISAVVTHDWKSIVETCDISNWSEILVAILTYADENELEPLCQRLGQRLEESGGSLAPNAELCYVTSGNINKLVDSWIRVNGKSATNIQDLVEVVLIIQKALQTKGKNVPVSGEFAELLSSYAEMLAAQGDLETALAYLANSNDEKIVSLKNRIERSLGVVTARQRSVSGNYFSQKRSSISVSNRQNVFQPSQPPTFNPAPAVNNVAPPTFLPSQPQQPAQPPAFLQAQTPAFTPIQNQSPFPASVPQPPPTEVPPPSTPGPFSRASSSPGPSLMSRSKYLVDPSVGGGMPGNSYYSSQSANYNSAMSRPQSSLAQPIGNSQFQSPLSPPPSNTFQPISGGISNQAPPTFGQNQAPPMFGQNQAPPTFGQSQGPPSFGPPPTFNQQKAPVVANNLSTTQQLSSQYSQSATPAPPGWNDPPMLQAPPKSANRVEKKPSPPPITHPLFGAVQPNDNFNQTAQNSGFTSQAPPLFNPAPVYSGGDVAHQPYYRNPQGESAPPTSLPPLQAQTLNPPTKRPLPEEHVHIQTVFDELRQRCHNVASNPISKKKIEDVSKKLDVMYDALRDNKLSSLVTQFLHQLVQFVQQGNYNGALVLHSQMSSSPNFSEMANFMSGLKILFQMAMQFGVYL